MKIMKLIGIVVLSLFALSGGIRVLSIGFGLVAAFGALAPEAQSEAIGHLIGASLVEIMIVYGLFKLVRSMKRKPVPTVLNSSGE